jgi:hexosaminidase
LRRQSGTFLLPARSTVYFENGPSRETVLLPLAKRLQAAAKVAGVELKLISRPTKDSSSAIQATRSEDIPNGPAAYTLTINTQGVSIQYREEEGLRAAIATLRQLLREYGRRLPCLIIHDHADFPKRGVMLDISRGRVPRLKTLLGLADKLADFKINEFQLYTEHTFAYRNYKPVWRDWGALTGKEIQKLDAHHSALPEAGSRVTQGCHRVELGLRIQPSV